MGLVLSPPFTKGGLGGDLPPPVNTKNSHKHLLQETFFELFHLLYLFCNCVDLGVDGGKEIGDFLLFFRLRNFQT